MGVVRSGAPSGIRTLSVSGRSVQLLTEFDIRDQQWPDPGCRFRQSRALPIPDRVSGGGAVRPVHLRDANERVAAAEALVFSSATGVGESTRTASTGPRRARVLPGAVRLIAIQIGNDAIATGLAFVVVEVGVELGGALHAGPMEHAAFTLVVEE